METIYLKASKKTIVTEKKVYIQDVAKVEGENQHLVEKIKKLPLLTVKQDKKKNYVVSVLEVIGIIQQHIEQVQIQNVGETDFIICYWPDANRKVSGLLTAFKVTVVTLTLFTGGAIAIMTFHNDASVPDVFKALYKVFTGIETEEPTILEIFYSIGLGAGIIIFFNHFTTVQISDDPTPIEVEMRLYEKDVEDSIIEALTDEGKNIDVD